MCGASARRGLFRRGLRRGAVPGSQDELFWELQTARLLIAIGRVGSSAIDACDGGRAHLDRETRYHRACAEGGILDQLIRNGRFVRTPRTCAKLAQRGLPRALARSPFRRRDHFGDHRVVVYRDLVALISLTKIQFKTTLNYLKSIYEGVLESLSTTPILAKVPSLPTAETRDLSFARLTSRLREFAIAGVRRTCLS